MAWMVLYHDAFLPELESLPEAVQDGLFTLAELLVLSGPTLGRPHADTLAGSKHANMKELRFTADDGVWRVAFAFDPKRRAIILVAGDKSGVAQQRFYKALIAKADARFAEHLDTLKG
ncbi:addiction module toxin RelE [Sphingobium lactosutens]|uniref:type II toxin-antitoxin system RelE/ParE family toxin n=1 Tax=Sphingobium lactosutens TaxID=522773 RepID=UPI0015C114C6|nr:type II toxin-antitoxin system RelE/ParE family toxin [Sphingobium lactosutens]NWK94287.1 addiction module toxin RelE [Sphingobium lactosutens]